MAELQPQVKFTFVASFSSDGAIESPGPKRTPDSLETGETGVEIGDGHCEYAMLLHTPFHFLPPPLVRKIWISFCENWGKISDIDNGEGRFNG